MKTELFETLVLCAEVAVPVPATDPFTYSVPDDLAAAVTPGVRVRIPFKNRETVGYVISVSKKEAGRRLKPVLSVLDEQPVLPENILKLTGQIAAYYGSSWGESIENALPKWVKYGKKAERALKVKETRGTGDEPAAGVFQLTEEQQSAYDTILGAMSTPAPKPILLHGVTGSGKSELYIRAIHEAQKQGKAAICLVPEITLTEQLRRFFANHFGDQLEVIHSKLSDGERFRVWKRLQQSQSSVVLGPRSAIFAPVPKLGLIIIDEEHENSYKQDTAPRYHAREVARWRSQNEGALLIMGTATPSMEAAHLCETGEFQRLDLKKRIDNKPLPLVMIVDLKEQITEKKKHIMFSRQLAKEIEINLARGEGTMLLLNRRGFSTNIHCPKCGHIENCEACQVALTYHQEDNLLLCHYCNIKKPPPADCPNCRMPLLRFSGFGTEKVESEIGRWFPAARTSRLDADTIRRKGSHEEILSDFRNKKIDILIGTQMIAKGFDFPHVTLVGVILADVGLMLPDFRSAERTFQLLTQVAGRAGRGDKPGRVIIQTYSPGHPSVKLARTHDYGAFFRQELPERLTHCYPPGYNLVNFIIRAHEESKVYQAARDLRDLIRTQLGIVEKLTESSRKGVEIIGPAPLPFAKLRGHFRWHVMVKFTKDSDVLEKCHKALSNFKRPSGVQIAVDVDPLNIL